MSEEEIIKYLKTIKPKNFNNYKDETPCSLITKKQIKAIQGLLDLYNKQKEENKKDIKGYSKMINSLEEQLAHKTKEIEELKEFKKQVEDIEYTNFVKYKNYISKDKIREKLEKLKEKEWELSDEQGYWGGSELQAKIEELEELLEEDENE